MRLGPTNFETQRLMQNDSQLEKLICTIGEMEVPVRDNHFVSLVNSIIGQQLSSRAASTLRTRIQRICMDITPERIQALSNEELRSCGISRPKIAYIKGLADVVVRNELDLGSLHSQSDDGVIEKLTTVKGIGRWTAEMFMIFSLGRTDVMSLTDVALQRSARWLYGYQHDDAMKMLQEVSKNWRPYRTIASLYLWAAIDRGFVDGQDGFADER